MAHGLGIRRGGRWILRPATFGISHGVIGLAGPAGEGKSTLLATVATLRRPAEGFVELLGHPVTGPAGQRAVRARLGLLPERFKWATGLTVGEFVGYAAFFKRMPRTAVGEALERFDLADASGHEIGRLPADMRLRAGLAATCVHRPDLVLLDEPLHGLDERERDELTGALREIAPTVVITAPDAAELTGWCDRVFTMTRGRLVESLNRPQRSRVPVGV